MKSRSPAEGGPPARVAALVLAAGKGTRMPGAGPKVLVECLGAPLIEHVRRAVAALSPDEIVVVIGHGKDAVGPWLASHWPSARAAVQEPQHGTGHAVRVGLAAIPKFEGDVVVVCGDVPQLRAEDLRHLLDAHRRTRADATVLVGNAADAGRLGRVVRDPATGRLLRIVEAKDATPDVLALREYNTGIYAFASGPLRRAVAELPRANAQGEEYLTDAVGRLAALGGRVEGERSADGSALLGVNTPADLATAVSSLRRRIIGQHLANGVLVVDPDSTVIEPDVEIAPGARILPFSYVAHRCRIGPDCVVGPFSHLRPDTVLERGAQVGNFVEVKASRLGEGAKAKHLSYLGDADVGAGANVGCGSITANYDGKQKHKSVIGAGAQIGSGTVLVAPVVIGPNARTGAGAIVLAKHDVPPGATAVGVPARVVDDGKASAHGPSGRPGHSNGPAGGGSGGRGKGAPAGAKGSGAKKGRS